MSPFKPSNRLSYQGPSSVIPSLEGNANDRSSALGRRLSQSSLLIPNNKRLSGASQGNPKRSRRELPESTKADEQRVELADGPGIETDRNSLIETAPREAWESLIQFQEDSASLEHLSGALNQGGDFSNFFGELGFGDTSASLENQDAEMGLASSSEEVSSLPLDESSLEDILNNLPCFTSTQDLLSYLSRNEVDHPLNTLEKDNFLNGSGLLEEAKGSSIKKMPPEMWDRVFKDLPSGEIFRAMRINREIGECAKNFIVSGYLKSGSSDNFSELTKLFERASKGSSSPWLNAFYQRVLVGKMRYKLNIFELEKLFNSPQPGDLDAVHKTGLLSDNDLQKLESASPEHIDYLSSERGLLALIDLKLKGVEFNPLAFLEVPSSSFDQGINFVINELVKNGFNTEESLSKICTLLASLNTSSLDPKLEENAAVKCFVAMVQSGLFVNRTERVGSLYTDTPLQHNIKDYKFIKSDMPIRILLAAGADPNQLDSEGKTPLYNAVRDGWLAGIQILLKHGADPTLPDKCGRDTLYALSQHNCYGWESDDVILIMDQLFSAGVLVNRQDNFRATVMHYVIRGRRQAKFISRLLQEGADVNIRDQDGETVIDCLKKEDRFYDIPEDYYLALILKHRPELRELFEKWKGENVEQARFWEDVLNYKIPPPYEYKRERWRSN